MKGVVKLDGASVLLVDDEVEFVETLTKRMNKRNVHAASVQSGESALEFLQENPVDVVVLDVKMPGMDGVSTLKKIKAQHPLMEVMRATE